MFRSPQSNAHFDVSFFNNENECIHFLVRTAHFWNIFYKVGSMSKDWKANIIYLYFSCFRPIIK